MSAVSRSIRSPLSPRLIFDPNAGPLPDTPPEDAETGDPGWRAVPPAIFGFYRDRLSWLALGVTAVVLSYVGGAAMFWFHAILLSEGGPAISWYAHWLLDSTFAFLVLTPALAVIMPLAIWAGAAIVRPGRPRLLLGLYAVIAGGLFALLTTPGPIAHDLIVGRGTWVAKQVTALIGDPNAPLAPVQDYAVPTAMIQQLGAGVAIYLVLTALSALLVRGIVARRRMRMRSVGDRVTIDP